MPVTIGSSSYIPPLPVESVVKERIAEIVGQEKTAIDVAIELCLYCMKTQVLLDGNKAGNMDIYIEIPYIYDILSGGTII